MALRSGLDPCRRLLGGRLFTSPRLDNVHRFMAGVYLSMGFICFWAAWTIRVQGPST